jgi:hypothetical protein
MKNMSFIMVHWNFVRDVDRNLNIFGWLGFTFRLSNTRMYGLPLGLNGYLTLSYFYKLN